MKFNKIPFVLLSACIFSGLTPLTSWADVNDVNRQGTELLQKNQAVNAYELLLNSYSAGEYDNQTLFLLGKSAELSGKLPEAERYYKTLLERDPNAGRIRLELASVLYKNGDFESAKKELLRVRDMNPPKQVGENIEQFLAAIEAGLKTYWSANASIGWMYDTNANAGPDSDTALMFGLPFLLSTDAKEENDDAWVLRFGVNHAKPFNGRASWQSSANVSWTDYSTLHRLDAMSLALSSGPTFQTGNDAVWSLPVIADLQTIGHSQSYYSVNYGVAPQYQKRIAEEWIARGSFSLSEKHYYDNGSRDTIRWSLSPALRYLVGKNSYVEGGASVGRENSGLDIYSNDFETVSLSYYTTFNKNWSFYLSPSYTFKNYEEQEAAYSEKRKDEVFNATANLAFFIESIKSNLTLSYTYTNNYSNVDIYQYDRTQTMLTLSKSF
ncbi:MAG: DUF560 domain-containing protein [Proteobacteria bacterium]|nr:DUF560 domain-containing protein [Pseudomonadota bacterium]